MSRLARQLRSRDLKSCEDELKHIQVFSIIDNISRSCIFSIQGKHILEISIRISDFGVLGAKCLMLNDSLFAFKTTVVTFKIVHWQHSLDHWNLHTIFQHKNANCSKY